MILMIIGGLELRMWMLRLLKYVSARRDMPKIKDMYITHYK